MKTKVNDKFSPYLHDRERKDKMDKLTIIIQATELYSDLAYLRAMKEIIRKVQ